ncbi:MAG: EhaD family protein [Methanobacteriaceae archaeon]|jgi:energy-converting hydrogenase A subunit D|nr:EhaD family protein [Candidatus Methanorudis spinitermitis]
MNLLDFINVTTLSIILMFIGALGIIWLIKPLDKLIMFAVMEAGFMLAVVSFKYLDVALVIALFGPITTIVFLLSIIKINEIRNNKKIKQEGNSID